LSPPSTLCGPIRQARSHLLTSPRSLGYTGDLARQLGLGCARVLPCFGSAPLPHVPSPLRREEKQGHIPNESLLSWPSSLPKGVGSSNNPDIGFSRAKVSTLRSVFALLRPAWLLALLDRSDLESPTSSPAAEDFLPELALGKVTLPVSRVSLHGPWGGYRDRTFTGWSTAVTGCTRLPLAVSAVSSSCPCRVAVSPSPAPASSNPACQFLAPGFPARVAARVMRPIDRACFQA
jgi:hypothetical protein